MNYFQTEYKLILSFIVAAAILSLTLLGIIYTIGFSSKVDVEKSAPYECGFSPFRKLIIF
jgi:NADH:ubiquinone oxidoreductase subunit 3 (subunit A)